MFEPPLAWRVRGATRGAPLSTPLTPPWQSPECGNIRRSSPSPLGSITDGRLSFDFAPGNVDQSYGLIYAWNITDPAGALRHCYVGKAKDGARRPLNDYATNVNNLLNGRPYRPAKPTAFRKVHKRLAHAADWAWPIELRLMCNVDLRDDIFAVEAAYIATLGFDDWPKEGRK